MGFDKDNLQWLAAPKVFGALLAGVLLKSALHVGADAGVETVVATMDDVNEPRHEALSCVSAPAARLDWRVDRPAHCRHGRHAL